MKVLLKSPLRRYSLDLVRHAPDTLHPVNVLELAVRLRDGQIDACALREDLEWLW